MTPNALEGYGEPSAKIGKTIDIGDRLPHSRQVDMEDLGLVVTAYQTVYRCESQTDREQLAAVSEKIGLRRRRVRRNLGG